MGGEDGTAPSSSSSSITDLRLLKSNFSPKSRGGKGEKLGRSSWILWRSSSSPQTPLGRQKKGPRRKRERKIKTFCTNLCLFNVAVRGVCFFFFFPLQSRALHEGHQQRGRGTQEKQNRGCLGGFCVVFLFERKHKGEKGTRCPWGGEGSGGISPNLLRAPGADPARAEAPLLLWTDPALT